MHIFILLVSIAYTSLIDHHGISVPVVFPANRAKRIEKASGLASPAIGVYL